MYRVCNCDSNIPGNCEVHGNIPPSGGCSLEHAVSSNQAIATIATNLSSGFGHCPICGQPATTGGFGCGYGNLTGCSSGTRRPGAMPWNPVSYPVNSKIDEELYRKLSQEIIMRDVYEKQAERLQEQVDYLTTKLDAPRKLFSVKSYLDHMAAELGKDYLDAYMIVYKKSMDLTAYDWSSTWDKYREYFKHQYKTIPKERKDQ